MVKTWFITGCSTGFGRALVEELLQTSAQVVATARNLESLKFLDSSNKNLLLAELDVTKPSAIQQAVSMACTEFGHIDVLVNNAGYGVIGALEEVSMEAARNVFETNFFGLMAVTKSVLPIMRAARQGHIINMSSVAGLVPSPGFSTYNAVKYAVEGVSEALAEEVRHLGIHVTLIEPGPFRTDFAGRSIEIASEIADYKDSVGQMRKYISAMSGNQPGDPIKAVKIIIEIANWDVPPLHLPLGNIAVDRIKTKFTKLQQNILDIEKLSRSADF